MANARKFDSPEKLDRHIRDFIRFCSENDEIPSDYMLCKFLMISPSTLERFRRGEEAGDTYKGFDAPLKRLQQFREHRLLTMLERDPKAGTAAIFQLKQSKNGGYTDSPINTGDQGATITLKIQGVGGADAFK